MANSTFLDLTNKLLRRLGEAEVSAGDFDGVRAVQASAKDFILDGVSEILMSDFEWPFLFVSNSQVLTVGEDLYTFAPSGGSEIYYVNLNSFRLKKDDTLGITTTRLTSLKSDDYYRAWNKRNEDGQKAVPRYVTPGPINTQFIVSPAPDKAYTIEYEAYKLPTKMSTYSDLCPIPDQFDYVVIDAALRHFYRHKDNSEQSDRQDQRYKESLSQMKYVLFPTRKDNMSDPVVNFGGLQRGVSIFQPIIW